METRFPLSSLKEIKAILFKEYLIKGITSNKSKGVSEDTKKFLAM
nr:hypothetical protein [Prochlorococcus marinus]